NINPGIVEAIQSNNVLAGALEKLFIVKRSDLPPDYDGKDADPFLTLLAYSPFLYPDNQSRVDIYFPSSENMAVATGVSYNRDILEALRVKIFFDAIEGGGDEPLIHLGDVDFADELDQAKKMRILIPDLVGATTPTEKAERAMIELAEAAREIFGDDSAMLGEINKVVETTPSSAKPQREGGINLNPALLDMQIKRDPNGIPLPFPQQPLENMHIEGFIPIIIEIIPISTVPMLLGESEKNAGPLASL
ncbi:MAG: hypothetical protein Q7S13_00200, partial [Candidatus Omnitrophota bacterium]|nr:hypothetical protein [Candidatus Omnitrophota bacterium]